MYNKFKINEYLRRYYSLPSILITDNIIWNFWYFLIHSFFFFIFYFRRMESVFFFVLVIFLLLIYALKEDTFFYELSASKLRIHVTINSCCLWFSFQYSFFFFCNFLKWSDPIWFYIHLDFGIYNWAFWELYVIAFELFFVCGLFNWSVGSYWL